MRVKATWFVKTLPERIDDIHISFGFADDQWDAFDSYDEGARITIKKRKDGYRIRYTCQVNAETLATIKECEQADDYDPTDGVWISPNVWEGMTREEEARITYSIK